jgi:hypothetical protein
MRWIVLGPLTVACLLAVSCGGGDATSSSDGGDVSDEAAARQFVNRTAEILRQARGPAYCKRLEPINERSSSPLACPAPAALRESLGTFEMTGVKVYGTGAVVDYKSGGAPDGASILLSKNNDGEWGITKFGLLYGKTVGSSDKANRPAFDRAVADHMRAIRDRDCKLYHQQRVIQPSNPKKACTPDSGFAKTKTIARGLSESNDPQPRYLGGNRAFGFYGLSLPKPKPRYVTISVIQGTSGATPSAGIYQIAPGPVAADR